MEVEQQRVDEHKSICVIAIGMAGSGKTTFIGKFLEYQSQFMSTYAINLDPAVKVIPYKPVLDIRETHEYRKIMQEYHLGPNGAILTALNLFTAQPERIVSRIQQLEKESPRSCFLIDIPGQIEAFTWSASSMILTKAIGLLMPVVLIFVVDGKRCQNPSSFLSNLLFARTQLVKESIEVRLQCPMIICLNKCDIVPGENCQTWIRDYQSFTDALTQQDTYLSSLSKTIVLHMSDFYEKFMLASISAKTGQGLPLLGQLIGKAVTDFKKKSQQQSTKQIQKQQQLVQQQVSNLRLSEQQPIDLDVIPDKK